MDIYQRDDLAFPQSLPEFQRLFPDEAACAIYLEKARWKSEFVCPHCGTPGLPFRFVNRPGILRCRSCRKNTSLTVGTVMERSHTPLRVWFWAAYLVSHQTLGVSAVQLQHQIGLKRYETAFQILHKLRDRMVCPDGNAIGGRDDEHVEVDETWIGGSTRGQCRPLHRKSLVVAAVEVRQPRRGAKIEAGMQRLDAGRIRLAVIQDRSSKTLCGFVERAVAPGTKIVTDSWSGYANITALGYDHHALAGRADPRLGEELLPIVHLVFNKLKTWLTGTHHGVSAQHLQAYLDEFIFHFNRRPDPSSAFRSLLGIAGEATAPTYDPFD